MTDYHADRLHPQADAWTRGISLEPRTPDVVARMARLLQEAEALTDEFGIDRALAEARRRSANACLLAQPGTEVIA